MARQTVVERYLGPNPRAHKRKAKILEEPSQRVSINNNPLLLVKVAG